jgi:unsaturated rhamnogalacturonyl hydrolase
MPVTGKIQALIAMVVCCLGVYPAFSQEKAGNKAGSTGKKIFWTEATSPLRIGKLVTADLLGRKEISYYPADFLTAVHYAEACTGFGAARLAGLEKDSITIQRLADRYLRVLREGPVNSANHVDANVYGILPLELYRQNGDTGFLMQGLYLADIQWKDPLPDGMTRQTRYWIDDVYMISALQAQAYRATGDTVYLGRAALEADRYIQRLQRPNGLFYHGENAPFFWGRGNGWVAAGLAELLSVLPASNIYYHAILAGFRKMMDALLLFQSREGLWRQLIDHTEAWVETSSSAMFGYAMAVGVKKGLLPAKKFEPAYQKAWLALAGYINAEGKMTDVCVGTGQSTDVAYYLARPKTTGDFHGHAPVLWFAYSLLNPY